MYEYRATIRRVYDGDTVFADIDLGFGVWLRDQSLRLLDVYAPEVRGIERPEGLLVRDQLRQRLPVDVEVRITTTKDRKGKYGRWLVVIYDSLGDVNAFVRDEIERTKQ